MWPMSFITLNRDTRDMKYKIEEAGQEHEVFQVETEDGYLLNLDRIPNKESFNVVYFQHGVYDSSQAWIIHGRDSSIAYLAHQQGSDIFMGNTRGVFPRKLADWK